MRRLLLLLCPVVLAVSACGVGTDDEPRVLPPTTVPNDLLDPGSTTSTILGDETRTVRVFLIDEDEHLEEVDREVTAPATVQKALESLVAPMTEEDLEDNLRTSLPSNLVIDVTPPTAGEVTVNVSDELIDITGEARRRAVAQLVYTATSDPDVNRVRILIEGEERPLQTGTGDTKRGPYSRNDYGTFERPGVTQG